MNYFYLSTFYSILTLLYFHALPILILIIIIKIMIVFISTVVMIILSLPLPLLFQITYI